MYISLIIPVHNGGDKFRQCLTSVYGCLDTDSEVIVVADGETDGAWRAALDYETRLVKLPSPQGAARARNAGACKATGDLLFFVDADVLLPKDALGKIRSVFSARPDVSAVIGSYDAEPSEPNFLSQYKNLVHHYVHQQGIEEASTFWGACGVVTRSAFWAVNGFSHHYRGATIEDIDLGCRLKQAGYRIRLVKDLQIKHLKHWSARSLLRADIFSRALPWSRLILQGHGLVNDLNLKTRDRVSLLLAYIVLLSLLTSFFFPWLTLSLGFAASLFLALNIDLYRFFWTKRGLGFSLQAVFWHWLYFLYSGLGFAMALIEAVFKKILAFTHSKQKKNSKFAGHD